MTVTIVLMNDNEPVLMLDGQDMVANLSTTYFERQPYLFNPTEIALSRELAIFDRDVGVQMLVEANVTILNGESEMNQRKSVLGSSQSLQKRLAYFLWA